MKTVNPSLTQPSTLAQRIERSIRDQNLAAPSSPQSPPRKNRDLIKNVPLKIEEKLESLHPASYFLTETASPFFKAFGEPVIDIYYEIVSELGKGTFGKVYLVKHRNSGEYFAIKRIDMTALKSSREKKNVSRELRLLKILHHPNIVKIIDIVETKPTTYIIMEHCTKGELHDYITSKGKLSELEARSFFRQIVSAVDYCHESSIVHRDLKPENLLMKDADCRTVKLIDFGFGNTWNEHGFLNTFCGSPFYAAPEMTQGIEYVGPEVDVWSLGVILYMMITGGLPFQGATITDLYASIAKGSYGTPFYLSSDAISLLSRMLDIHPRRRATLEEIKNHPWTILGYKYGPVSGVPYRPNILDVLDEETLQELISLGYSKYEYYHEFKNNQRSPIKNLYHLHYEWLHRKRMEGKKTFENFLLHDKSEQGAEDKTDSSSCVIFDRIEDVNSSQSPCKPKHTSFWAKILGKNKSYAKKCVSCIKSPCNCNRVEETRKALKLNNSKVAPLK